MISAGTQPSWMIIVLESTAVLLLLFSGLLFHVLRQSRRDQKVIRDFVAAVHNDLKARRNSLINVMDERFRAGGDTVNMAIDELVEIERDIYRTMATAYHHRDGIALLKAHTGLKKMLWACLDMVPEPHEFGTAENQARFQQLERELAAAEEQKQVLNARIQANDQEMRTLLAEYQRIFSKSQMEADTAAGAQRARA
jgi:hypothetical protein